MKRQKSILEHIQEARIQKNEALGRLWFKLSYNGKEIDTWEISKYLGKLIPDNFDKSKFKVDIDTKQNF